MDTQNAIDTAMHRHWNAKTPHYREGVIYFVLLNIVCSWVMSIYLSVAQHEMSTHMDIVYGFIALMLVMNIIGLVRYATMRLWFSIIIICNLVGNFMFGSLSFATAIPDIPMFVKGYYMSYQQYGSMWGDPT